MPIKPYSAEENSSEDLTTFLGRFKHFQNYVAFSESNCIVSNTKLLEYQSIIKDKSKWSQYSDKELWKMRYIVDSSIHPQTNEVILWPLRTSTFVPVNVPIILGLVVLPPTVRKIFLQLFHKATQLVNIPNNKSDLQFWVQFRESKCNKYFHFSSINLQIDIKDTFLIVSYLGAVASAIGGSLGTAKLFKRMNLPSYYQRLASLIGVLIANTFNLAFSRYQDFQKGVEVYDDDTGDRLPGFSKNAAFSAFQQTWVTRVVIPLPLWTPPIITYLMQKYGAYPKHPAARGFIDIFLTAFMLYAGLSAAISIFPQYIKKDVNFLEKEYQQMRNSKNELVRRVRFNKGL